MHSFQNFIVRLIPNHPPPLETRIWKLVVRALLLSALLLFLYELPKLRRTKRRKLSSSEAIVTKLLLQI